ncbi:hypothetical protein PHLCEN_2v12639 [Hermanssonia centrifuga]|uniref:Uncharacterized protein n=1 Tax=Hermanssonia centrifuga TaxID=98765 RepID=A0A2R6NGG2_9APHY|nr:hypothetical protein PHLCEN_2v12639 [Hermanssonia centrifuga]
MNMSSTPAFGQGVLNHSSTNPGPSLYTPYLTLVLPDTTYISPLAPRPTSATPSNTPVTVEEENEHLRDESGQKMTSNAIRDYGLRMNLERLKFRLVFILWPALVGMTMAL